MDMTKSSIRKHGQGGFSLVELLIAMAIMVVGMIGIVALFLSAAVTATRNNHDTTGTMLAETVINEIASFNANANPTLTIKDCAGTSFNIATTGSTAGSGATLLGSTGAGGAYKAGTIDWSEAQSAVAAKGNYTMDYVSCGATAAQNVTYEVRWNITSMPTTMTGNQYAKLVTVSARIKGAKAGANGAVAGNIQIYSPPATIRTVVGMTN
jgi:prepilin-type N-terminal cleavage/methylation domain-containing protein